MAEPHLHLLHGEETYAVEEEARALVARWRQDLVSDFGFEAMEPGGLTAARLQEALLQLPFLDPCRVVAVKLVPSGRADQLAPALAGVPETTRLVMTVQGQLRTGSRLAKAFAAAGGRVREFPRLKGRALMQWAQDRARAYNLPGSLAAQVLRASPPDLGVIDSELRKLAAYRDSGAPLDAPAVEALLAGGREEDIFRLTDQLVPRPAAGAWKVARGLVAAGMGPTTVAYRLARQLALVLAVKTRQDRGEGLAQVQAAMREHPFVLQKAFDMASTTTTERLEAGLRAVLAYEWEVKSGQVDAELGLEVLLARL